MKKRDYNQPKIKVLDICGRRSLLQGIHVGGTVTGEGGTVTGEGGDIGFSKGNDFDFEDDSHISHYNVWGDE